MLGSPELNHRINVERLLQELLDEQRETNQLLVLLVQALSEEEEPDEEPATYLDGTPCP